MKRKPPETKQLIMNHEKTRKDTKIFDIETTEYTDYTECLAAGPTIS